MNRHFFTQKQKVDTQMKYLITLSLLWLGPIKCFLHTVSITENTAAPSKILALAHMGQNGITVTLNRDMSSYSDVHWYRHGDIAPAITMADTHSDGAQHTAGERQIHTHASYRCFSVSDTCSLSVWASCQYRKLIQLNTALSMCSEANVHM